MSGMWMVALLTSPDPEIIWDSEGGNMLWDSSVSTGSEKVALVKINEI